jgi:hypothetical protein
MVKRMDIYRSETLRVLRTGAGSVDFVTFQNLGPPGRPAFGSRWAHRHGLNALHVLPRGNDWYQYPDLDACLDAVARVTAPHATASGGSMGGYAVTTYADRLGVAKTISFGPQYSIQRAARVLVFAAAGFIPREAWRVPDAAETEAGVAALLAALREAAPDLHHQFHAGSAIPRAMWRGRAA